VIRGTGRRRAGEDNVRLRRQVTNLRDDLAWYRRRLKDVTAKCRAYKAQAEIAQGELLLAEQLIQRQTEQLMQRDSQIDQLQRQLKADAVRTQEIPVVTEAELSAA
jgi:chromosome segregation ATPase